MATTMTSMESSRAAIKLAVRFWNCQQAQGFGLRRFCDRKGMMSRRSTFFPMVRNRKHRLVRLSIRSLILEARFIARFASLRPAAAFADNFPYGKTRRKNVLPFTVLMGM